MTAYELIKDMDASKIPRPDCYEKMWAEDWQASSQQMMIDLHDLATKDGCIAAAWAFTVIEKLLTGEK